jgi:glycosyltransferase involved in cell wall biosynthesis
MLAPVQMAGNLKSMASSQIEVFTEFDHVALLTQDTVKITDTPTGIEHVPCAYSRSKRVSWILSKFTYLRWIYFYFYSFFWILKHRKSIKLLISINVDSPAPLFSMLFGLRCVVHYHYDTAYQVRHVNGRYILGILLLGLERFAFKRACSVWITSPGLMAKVKMSGARRIRIIPNWVDIKEIEGIQVFKKRSSGLCILFAGRLHRVKQVDLLIRAFRLVHERISNASLYVLGDGEQRQDLIALAKNLGLSNSIHFVGFVDQRTVIEMMKLSDVLVLPSKMEGNPRVLIEAMANKVPIVATNVPGIRDMIKHMKTGYLINSQQPEELAYALEYVLRNKRDSADMVRNAYAFVNQYFSKETVLQKIRDDLVILLSNHKDKR